MTLDEPVRRALERVAASAKSQVRQVLRARIVLAAADGLANAPIGCDLGVSVNTVRKWRGRFARHGTEGLKDADRTGRPKVYDDKVRVALVAAATSAPSRPAATWTHRAIAEQVAGTLSANISPSQVGRILDDLDLKPHKVRGWLTRRDTPDFWQRAEHICDLYRDPPAGALLLSIDEKTAIAARSRKHPASPAAPGRPARQEFEYVRHGTASLVAAMDVRTGEVLTQVITRNNAVTFTAFLDHIDALVPEGTDIHVVLDNGQRLIAHRQAHQGVVQGAPALDGALHPAPRLLAQPDRTGLLRPDPRRPAPRRLRQPRRPHRQARQLHHQPQRERQALPLDLQGHPTQGSSLTNTPPRTFAVQH
ncbi:IS630 family transposase [Streptomyces sp. H27-H5]|nr:IS630 family transposase [Streptomyces sp. H27-H5]MCY0963471.1 IS630 family transposase [Streptomyces sp. H27-H5]